MNNVVQGREREREREREKAYLHHPLGLVDVFFSSFLLEIDLLEHGT